MKPRDGRRLALMMTLSLLGGIAGSAGAVEQGPSIERHPQAIPVSGRSVSAALRALQADEQVRAHALTRSLLSLRLELMPEALPGAPATTPGAERCPTISRRGQPAAPECRPQACRLTDFEVGLRIDLLLPEWDAPASASAEERALWTSVRDRLEAHEQRHREHAEAAAARLHAQLAERRGRVEAIDCLRLRSQLEGLRQREVQNLRLRDRVFDETSADALKLRRRLR
jgi:hypothetical protein